ncbi:MAG: retropepsin-like aspartic protease family protein [Aestuariivirgaceae bacterium]
MSATFSVAERIVAKDQPQSDTETWVSTVKSSELAHRVMGSRWVEIGASKYGHYVTRVSINGAKVWALVDTGASAVAMSYEDAERAGLNPFRLKFSSKIRTANGVTRAARGNLKQVVVEGITVTDVEGMVMRKGAMRGTLLGMSFLRRLNGFRVEQGVLYLEE